MTALKRDSPAAVKISLMLKGGMIYGRSGYKIHI